MDGERVKEGLLLLLQQHHEYLPWVDQNDIRWNQIRWNLES